MLKKSTAIIFLALAYATLLGHNFIPHHHHSDLHELTEHHQFDHHYDHDDDQDHDHHNNFGLGHLLSHFIHSVDNFTLSGNHQFAKVFPNHQQLFVAGLPDNFSFDSFRFYFEQQKTTVEHLIYFSPHAHASGLRAPPVSII